MKKITGVSVRTAAEGKCVSYAFREMDEAGNITSAQKIGSFIALDSALLDAIAALEQAAEDHLGEE